MFAMEKLCILLSNRMIKLVANALKPIGYGFHALWPNKRFVLPDYSGPLLQSRRPSAIPRIIWQTNYTNRVTLPIFLNYLFNRLLAPCHEYRFMGDAARETFIAEAYSDKTLDQYRRLQIGAARADLWRLLVLQRYGGVYLDIDAHLVWPLERILRDRDECYVRVRDGGFSNYFIASKPHNPNLAAMIRRVSHNIDNEPNKGVFSLTGPGVLNDVLDPERASWMGYRYVSDQGNFTNEHFQYIDKPGGKWHQQQKRVEVVQRRAH